MNRHKIPILPILSALLIVPLIYAGSVEQSRIRASSDADTLHYEPVRQYETVNIIKPFDTTYLTVSIKSTEKSVETVEKSARYDLTAEEKRMLCYVADSEDHTSVESRQAVMQVVMNRIASEKFPETVTDVLYAPKQFAVMKRYSEDYTPSGEAVEALERLLWEDDIFGGEQALFFARADVSPSRIARGLQLVDEIGGSKFWRQE